MPREYARDDVYFIKGDHPHGELALRYLNLVLAGQREAASRLILDAVDAGISVRDVYLEVFQPVLYEIGRLWQINEISVAVEHYSTAITQTVMSQLYPRIFTAQKNGLTLVATSVGAELHEIGIRMVADLFEIEGWSTFYLGANAPTTAVVAAIQEQTASLLALSATMSAHVAQVASIIEAVKRDSGADPFILVGGAVFNRAPGLWKKVGADATAGDAGKAVQLAKAHFAM